APHYPGGLSPGRWPAHGISVDALTAGRGPAVDVLITARVAVVRPATARARPRPGHPAAPRHDQRYARGVRQVVVVPLRVVDPGLAALRWTALQAAELAEQLLVVEQPDLALRE